MENGELRMDNENNITDILAKGEALVARNFSWTCSAKRGQLK